MELTKAVSQQEMGGEEAILSSDPNSDRDISNWVAKQGHRLAAKIPHDGFLELIVRKMEE
jgi:TusA-related sulfurtransferase